MPQGNFKKSKSELPKSVTSKDKHQKKLCSIRKGVRDIAPKKARHVEEVKMKKNLDKAIRMNVEKKISQHATETEAKLLAAAKSSKSAVKSSDRTSCKSSAKTDS
jgi:hypothetical protein